MMNRWILSGFLTTLWTASTSVAGSPCILDSDCDDFNPCTRDVCSRLCVHTPLNRIACNDSNQCTTNDTCTDGVCIGTPVNCPSDGNPCTINTCLLGQCTEIPLSGIPCADGNACTTSDQCSFGGCIGTPMNCDDGKVCTTDTCSPATGCVFTNNSEPCDDGMFCTVDDVCTNAECGGSPRDCSEVGDQCNLGVCNEATNLCEPQPAEDGTSCDDDNTCTSNDHCISGICRGEQAFGLEEWRQFTECYDGVGVPVEVGCKCFDLDGDGEVHLQDVSEFMLRFDGN